MTRAKRPRAVLFDLDGTLYYQTALRLLMAPDLALACVADRGHTARALLTFRKAREKLRELGAADEPLERLQYSEPARVLGCDSDWLERLVADWIMRRPLKRLRHCRRRDLLMLLEAIESRGVLAGVFSDYPTQDKLDALGVRQRFSLELCALDASINAFKPHPRGFLAACERWGIPPADVVYVGDRPSIDGAGATAAGMRASIVGRGSGFKHIVQEIFADG